MPNARMTEEQRKAMFARLRAQGITPYDATGRAAPQTPSLRDKAAAVYSGFSQGANEGAENVMNAYTFGATDRMGLTHTYEQTGAASEWSKVLAGLSAIAAYTATGAQLAGVGGGVGIGGGAGAATGPLLSREAIDIYQNGRGAAEYLDDAIERWASPVWDYRIDAVTDIANHGQEIMQDLQRYNAAFAGNVDRYAPSTEAMIAEAGQVIEAAMKVLEKGMYPTENGFYHGFYPIGNYLSQYNF